MLSIAGNELRPHDVATVTKQLHKFPALSRLDVSANPELRGTGVVVMMSSLSGARFPGPRYMCVCVYVRMYSCACRVHVAHVDISQLVGNRPYFGSGANAA